MFLEKTSLYEPSTRKIPFWADFLFLIILYFIAEVATVELLMALFPESAAKDLDYLFTSRIVATTLVFALVVFLHYVIDKRPWKELGISTSNLLKSHVLIGCLLPLAIYTIGLAICVLTNSVSVVSISFSGTELFLSLVLFIIGAFLEELLCRGYILTRLWRTRLNPIISITLSSIVFSALHLANPNMGLWPLINLFLAGGLFGIMFLYTRNLLFPTLAHFMWNWLQGSVFGFKVSGHDYFDSVIGLHMDHANLINGGEFGFEGSIVCVVLQIVSIAFLYKYLRKSSV